MHLKLDQLVASETITHNADIRIELGRLRDIANESYEIVRDILKRMQPETIPHLTNLLREHAGTISRRSKFELDFQYVGKPVHLPANTQQLIFFTFREILSNVEKHACAQRVDILVTWSEQFLDITVADNGKGFDPSMVWSNEHFGLDIMHERISSINGRFVINSSIDTGTVVSLSIPLEAGRMVVA
jgi:two-component system sensor histidine kinase DegS